MIKNIIKNICEGKKISLPDLAKKIGMSKAGFYTSLNNNTIKVDTLQKIADVLEVDIKYFFGGDPSTSSGEAKKVVELEKRVKELDEQLNDKKELIKHNTWIIETIKHAGIINLDNIDIVTAKYYRKEFFNQLEIKKFISDGGIKTNPFLKVQYSLYLKENDN